MVNIGTQMIIFYENIKNQPLSGRIEIREKPLNITHF